MKAKVTRRTIVGYAVNTHPVDDNPGYHFDLPTTPEWTGTAKTVQDAMDGDAYLNSLTNTYYSAAWFVKVNGTWMRVVDSREFGYLINHLYTKSDWDFGVEYVTDAVEVDVDYVSETARAAAAMGRKPKGDKSRENGRKHTAKV
jgi:hypothetical protein